jgi:hypothetical protein
MGTAFESIQSRDAEEKPSQSQFEAEKPLRRRCCRTISESSGRPFRVPFFVHGSRDLGEHDQISLVAIRHCNDVLLSFRTEIKKPPHREKARRRRQSCAELRYQPAYYGLLFMSFIAFQICTYVYGYIIPFLFSFFR